jgi:hypothetical protein
VVCSIAAAAATQPAEVLLVALPLLYTGRVAVLRHGSPSLFALPCCPAHLMPFTLMYSSSRGNGGVRRKAEGSQVVKVEGLGGGGASDVHTARQGVVAA